MAMFEDSMLSLQGDTEEKRRDFRIAWLNRRVENLEAIVFELLRDRAHYETLEGYKKSLESPGFTPSSTYIKGAGARVASTIDRWPVENLGWPEKDNKREDAE